MVGAEVHQGCIQHRCLAGQDRGRDGVDGPRERRLALGPVDGGVGRCIHDDVRAHVAHRCRQGFGAAEICREWRAVARQCQQFAEGRERTLELPAYLAVLAEQQDPHAGPGVRVA